MCVAAHEPPTKGWYLDAEAEMRRVGKRGQRALMLAAAVGAAAYFGTSRAHAGDVDAFDPNGTYNDYLVDPSWTGAQGGTTATGADAGFAGVWSTITGTQGALNSNTGTVFVNSGASATNPNRIFIDPGSYNVGTTF